MTAFAITVIIPTTCRSERAELLRGAIASAICAAPGEVEVLVAINGPHVDERLAAELRRRSELRVVRFVEGSLPIAMRLAMENVESEFFGFLDDDDELLENGMTKRLEALRGDPKAELVLSNGYRHCAGRDEPYLARLGEVSRDPLRALFVENWLPSCGALFRRSRIEPAMFDDFHPHAEWSWLAFRHPGKRIVTLNEATFRVRVGTPGSLSKSRGYRLSYVSLYERMLAINPPADVRATLRRRLSQAHHDVSEQWLKEGAMWNSVLHHAKSLAVPYGWRFIGYSRHMLRALWKQPWVIPVKLRPSLAAIAVALCCTPPHLNGLGFVPISSP